MERSLFYIYYGKQSNQVGKFQYEDQGHHGPSIETKQFCQSSSVYMYFTNLILISGRGGGQIVG